MIARYHLVFVYCNDLDEDQIPFHSKLMQLNSSKGFGYLLTEHASTRIVM